METNRIARLVNQTSHKATDFFRNESGLSSVEYVIAGAVILVVLGTMFSVLVTETQDEMNEITTSIPS